MKIEQSICNFYEHIEIANKRLRQSTSMIEHKREEIKQVINGLVIDKTSVFDKSESSPIKELCRMQEEEYKKSVDFWKEEINRYIKGKEFVNQFEKSLLLMVFGDVKAGKSALGNLVSGNYLEGTKYEHLRRNPKFYRYAANSKENVDTGRQELKEQSFIEDVVEATSTIQYFTLLEGMTWVDTPGIHSLTVENQELANEYIKYADLILFLTPSNNPCKQDENSEIKRLVDLDKPLLLAITKSDEIVKEVVNGKLESVLRPKSDEKRSSQEQYVKGIVREIGKETVIKQNKYISISSLLAKNALQNDDETMYKQSNIDEFYKQLSVILSERAIELKMKRPKDELNFVITELLEGSRDRNILGIHSMKDSIEKILEEIDRQKEILDKIKREIAEGIKMELMTDILDLMNAAKMSGEISDSDVLSEKISIVTQECTERILSRRIAEVLSDFKNYTIDRHVIQMDIRYEKKYETIEYQVYDVITVSRPPQGLIEHVMSWFGKEFETTKLKTVNKTQDVFIGDNYNEIFEKTWTDLGKQITLIVDNEVNKVKTEYFQMMEDYFREIRLNMDTIREKLIAIKF